MRQHSVLSINEEVKNIYNVCKNSKYLINVMNHNFSEFGVIFRFVKKHSMTVKHNQQLEIIAQDNW